MEKSSLKLECLKLALMKSAHNSPDEIVLLARKFEDYCTESNKQEQGTSSVGNSQEPIDGVKEHKNIHSKKKTP